MSGTKVSVATSHDGCVCPPGFEELRSEYQLLELISGETASELKSWLWASHRHMFGQCGLDGPLLLSSRALLRLCSHINRVTISSVKWGVSSHSPPQHRSNGR